MVSLSFKYVFVMLSLSLSLPVALAQHESPHKCMMPGCPCSVPVPVGLRPAMLNLTLHSSALVRPLSALSLPRYGATQQRQGGERIVRRRVVVVVVVVVT